jgi:hypothetical protein
MSMPVLSAAVNRRPTGQLEGSGHLSWTVAAAARAFPAEITDLRR